MPLPPNLPRARSARYSGKSKDESKRVLANRYQIQKRLGSGNFGTAWLVKDLKCKDQKEQLKVLKEISVGDLQPDETVDAMHEANLLRNLDHPGIVKFYDSFIESEFFCIITEYCEGGDLDNRISTNKKAKKAFSEAQIVEWTIQLLLAVQYMHSRRVLHRDLKARNIFLRNNRIKIGDFGISRILMGTTDMASTFTGTPYYMSPEVLKHEGYNSKSDVWSVGCLIYELAALTHAFEGQSLMGVMYKIVEGSTPSWPEQYTKKLRDVFLKLLEKEPSKRLSAAEALKLPFIAKQMESLKNTMIDKHQAKENGESVNKESEQLAKAFKKKSHLDQLRRESEAQKQKNMSPRERMRLRKQQKADEEARRLRKKYDEIRTSQDAYAGTEAPWLRPQRDAEDMEFSSSRPYTAPIKHNDHVQHEYDDSDEDEFDEDEVMFHRQAMFQTEPGREQHQPPDYKQAFGTYAADDRPITPMKNMMVYDRQHSSLDFEGGGVPAEPAIADTFYAQYDDEFEKANEVIVDDEDDYEGTLLAPVYDRGAQKEDEEVSDLISCMQNALDRPESAVGNQTLTDGTLTDAYGPAVKETKIKNLKSECISKLGDKEFQLAYDYLKAARFGPNSQNSVTLNENKLMSDLKKIVSNPNDCFLVEQLLFLEEQSKIS